MVKTYMKRLWRRMPFPPSPHEPLWSLFLPMKKVLVPNRLFGSADIR